MSAIIAALFSLLGPLLIDLIRKWLEPSLEKAGKGMRVGDEAATGRAVLSRAIKQTPLRYPGRRVFMHILRRALPEKGAIPKRVPAELRAELKDAAGAAAKEK